MSRGWGVRVGRSERGAASAGTKFKNTQHVV